MKINLLVLFNIFVMLCYSCGEEKSEILSPEELAIGYKYSLLFLLYQ